MSKEIEILLSPAQERLAHEVVESHQAMGDCHQHGLVLRFPDYEGALAVHGDILTILAKAPTCRAYRSLDAIIRKIDLAMAHCFRPKEEGGLLESAQ